jgi:hypothetical protein
MLKKYDYPDDIKELIKIDFNLFENFIKMYQDETILKIQNNNFLYHNISKIKNYEFINNSINQSSLTKNNSF